MRNSNKDRYICADDYSCGLATIAVWTLIALACLSSATYLGLKQLSPQREAIIALRSLNESRPIDNFFEEVSLQDVSGTDVEPRSLAAAKVPPFCDIDELENKFGAHQCLVSDECKGTRVCTTFGWCRGKTLCEEGSREAACKVVEAEGNVCQNDKDCQGERLCDDDLHTCDGPSRC